MRPSRRDELLDLKRYLAEDAARTQPQADYAMAIRAELPDDGIYVQESTQVGYWSSANFPVYQPRTYFTSGYQGTLGFGFATALGVQAGAPDRKVVSVNGDGGFFYNVQELSTMVQQHIPLTAIVFNDNAYGNVKRIQEMRFGGRTIASTLHNPDMLKLAEAYGLEGRRATSPGGAAVDAATRCCEERAGADRGGCRADAADGIQTPEPGQRLNRGRGGRDESSCDSKDR